jgi:hypothetical protein
MREGPAVCGETPRSAHPVIVQKIHNQKQA